MLFSYVVVVIFSEFFSICCSFASAEHSAPDPVHGLEHQGDVRGVLPAQGNPGPVAQSAGDCQPGGQAEVYRYARTGRRKRALRCLNIELVWYCPIKEYIVTGIGTGYRGTLNLGDWISDPNLE